MSSAWRQLRVWRAVSRKREGTVVVGVVLGIFEQALLLGSLVVFTTYLLWHTTRTTSRQELALRLMSLFAGAGRRRRASVRAELCDLLR